MMNNNLLIKGKKRTFTFKLNKNYLYYSVIAFCILIDAIFLYFIGENYSFLPFYILVNVAVIIAYCARKSATECAILSLLLMLVYTFIVDGFIHYLKFKVIIEAEFIFLVPLAIACFKVKPKKLNIFVLLGAIYLVFNFFFTIITGKVSLYNYLTFMVNILTFLGFFYVFGNIVCNQRIIDLYKFIFYISLLLTVFQTAVHFNTDTRNGLFSVFGFGAYTIFLMVYIVFYISEFVQKKISIFNLALSMILIMIIYICIEAKAAFVMVFINFALIALLYRGNLPRKTIIFGIALFLLPSAYLLLLKYNPKFYYLTNFEAIWRYYTGNNNWHYQYGRFPAIIQVFSERDWFTRIWGIGFGGSTPLYNVFFLELERNIIYPYYINMYSYRYGYQHTSISSLLLDGGLVLAGYIVSSLIAKLVITIKRIRTNRKDIANLINFGLLVYLLYYFTYANILKDFRAMAMTAICLSLFRIEGCIYRFDFKNKITSFS